LKTRRVLRRLLYALASRPNTAVSRDDLVQEVWSATYHPLVHDNVLLVNITRLRALVEGTGLAIEADEGGYRLLL
jgi:DNA-binding response OmpR family regulator